MAFDRAIDYSIQIAGALAASHSADIIHRDLKPANVMVTREGLIKVLGFRPGEMDARACRRCRCRDRDRGSAYGPGCDRRQQRIHVARAGARATGRCAVRCVLVRRRVVRAARRTTGVRRRIRVVGDKRARARSADAVAGRPAGRSRSAQRKSSGAASKKIERAVIRRRLNCSTICGVLRPHSGGAPIADVSLLGHGRGGRRSWA